MRLDAEKGDRLHVDPGANIRLGRRVRGKPRGLGLGNALGDNRHHAIAVYRFEPIWFVTMRQEVLPDPGLSIGAK